MMNCFFKKFEQPTDANRLELIAGYAWNELTQLVVRGMWPVIIPNIR